jgi:hypothetical protein
MRTIFKFHPIYSDFYFNRSRIESLMNSLLVISFPHFYSSFCIRHSSFYNHSDFKQMRTFFKFLPIYSGVSFYRSRIESFMNSLFVISFPHSLFFILYSLFFILYSLFFILHSSFFILQLVRVNDCFSILLQCSTLCVFAHSIRRLKPTATNISSLRDFVSGIRCQVHNS